MPRGHRHLAAESRAGLRRRDTEVRPWQQQLGGDARLVGAEIYRFGSEHRFAVIRDRGFGGAGAQHRRHRRMVVQFGARRNEEQREAARAGAEIHSEFQAIGVAEREAPGVGEQLDVEIILPDRPKRQAAFAPRQVDFAEIDRARRGLERQQEALGFRPVRQRIVVHVDRRVRQHDRRGRRRGAAGGGGMDGRRLAVGGGERLHQLLIRVVVDIHQAEIVILAVGAAALRMVVILKPLGADDLWQRGKVASRLGGAAGPLGLRADRHQMAVIAVAGAVLARREKPFGDQDGLAAGQFFQPIEEIGRDPAVAGIDIVVDRERIDMRRHRPHRRRIVIDRQAVAEIERLRVGGADRVLGERVIALGDDAGPLPYRRDAVAARPQGRQLLCREQLAPRADSFRRMEVGGEAPPVIAIVLAQHRDPALLGEIVGRFDREEAEQRAGPPADLIVGKIADAVGRAAIRRDQLAGDSIHAALHAGRERVEPVEFRVPAELQVDDRGQPQLLRRQRPPAGAVEAPGSEPVAGFSDPVCQRRSERLPAVIDLAVLAALRIPAVEDVDADAVEAVAAGRLQPIDAVLGDNRPAARRRPVEIAGKSRRGRADCKKDGGKLTGEPASSSPLKQQRARQ